MDERTDEELLAAVAAGPGALPEFYRRHVGKIVGMGVRRFDNREDVADFVADVFVAVLTSADRFDPRRGRAVPWLCGLAANIAAAQLRRRQRDADLQRQVIGRTFLAADDYARVDEQLDAAAQWRAVYAGLRSLSDADRRLLELVAVDGLSSRRRGDRLGHQRGDRARPPEPGPRPPARHRGRIQTRSDPSAPHEEQDMNRHERTDLDWRL